MKASLKCTPSPRSLVPLATGSAAAADEATPSLEACSSCTADVSTSLAAKAGMGFETARRDPKLALPRDSKPWKAGFET